MNRSDRIHATTVVEAGSAVAAESPPVAAPKAAAKLQMLDGDEIVQLSIKPSLWYIPRVSLRVCTSALVLAVVFWGAMRGGITAEALLPFQVLIAIAVARLAFATLQWATQLYVLTNRRVMQFRGIHSVRVNARPLAQIAATERPARWYDALLRLGTIRMRSADLDTPPVMWEDLARPDEVHEILIRAIRKSQSRD
jgi:hypothetical protein